MASLAGTESADAAGVSNSQKQHHLDIPLARRRSRSPSPNPASGTWEEEENALRRTASSRSQQASLPEPEQFDVDDGDDLSKQQKPVWRRGVSKFWVRNKGIFLVLVAQFFGTLMNVTTRMLENPAPSDAEEKGLHPFQIIFARMSITSACSFAFMWWQKIPDSPFGAKEVRWLLVARGVGGFFGVFGLYSSLQYLPLNDATVLTFLAPMISCWVCSKLINEPFTRIERIGALISLVGVVFIARPTSIFASTPSAEGDDPVAAGGGPDSVVRRAQPSIPPATPQQRLEAVAMAMVGVCGAVCAYTTIRWIGHRAHPLLSVNYFAFWCTVVSAFALAFVPSVPFILPHTVRQWLLLLFIGVSGFVMQYFLTAGLRYEKSSRSTNMVYVQMLFALLFDRVVWGTVPDAMSLIGSSLIFGCAIVVAVQKETSAASKRKKEQELAAASSAPVDVERGSSDEEDERAALVENMEAQPMRQPRSQ